MPVGTARSLPAQFEVGQGSESLYARFEVGQDSVELFIKSEIQQKGSAELLIKVDVTHSVELLGRLIIRDISSAELLGGAGIRRLDSVEVLGKCSITHSTELPGNAVIRRVDSVELYALFEVGQNAVGLFAKFESQATRDLYAKSAVRRHDTIEVLARAVVGQDSVGLLGWIIVRHSTSTELKSRVGITHSTTLPSKFIVRQMAPVELLAGFEVGQGSTELFGRGVIKNVGSLDLQGSVSVTHSSVLLGKVVIGHPALPVWLKAIFSIGITNAYVNLDSILELRYSDAAELYGKADIMHSTELLGKTKISHIEIAELIGRFVVRHVGTPLELLGKGVVKKADSADLYAKMRTGLVKDSDVYLVCDDPASWINFVSGIGRGFITMPWVEMDSLVRVCGDSSARLTSTRSIEQYKEIKFGWRGRGPLDLRREVPEEGLEELAAFFVVSEEDFKDLGAKFEVMADYTTWTYVWSRDYTPVLFNMLLVDNSGTVYGDAPTGGVDKVRVRTYAGVETNIDDYTFLLWDYLGGMSVTGKYVVGLVPASDTFEVWKDGVRIFSRDISLDDPAASYIIPFAISPNGKFVALVCDGATSNSMLMLYEGS